MNVKLTRRTVIGGAAAGATMVAAPRLAFSQEVTLKAVSAWTEGTAFSRAFERYVERVNETGTGKIRYNYLGGGAKIMNVFDMGQALRRGVFDVVNTTAGYYAGLVPEANAMKLAQRPYSELKTNGFYDAYDGLLQEKANAHWIGRGKGNVPFYLFLSKSAQKLDGIDFSKHKIRVSPNYRALLTQLGATLVQTQGSEIYTAMERNVVDGFGWPTQGIDELGLLPVTKYRIEPSFFVAPNEILINLDSWNKLNDQQKKVLTDAAEWVESWLEEYELEENAKAIKLQDEAEIEPIKLSDSDATKFLNIAYETGWKEVLALAPETGAKLKPLLSK